MNQLYQYLNQPMKVERQRWRTAIITALLVLFVLGAFQPFGISSLDLFHKMIVWGMAVLGSFVGLIVVFYLFPVLFRGFYTHWTVGKNILNNILVVFMIGLANGVCHVIYSYLRFGYLPPYWYTLFVSLFIATLMVSPVPIIVNYFMIQNQILKSNLQEAQDLNMRLAVREKTETIPDVAPSFILSGSTKESVEALPDELLYLEACGNYVKVFYQREGEIRQKMLRTTIKQMEDSLENFPFILRCHRAFLVNINRITTVKGNSQGYKLVFSGIADEVPVSRAYTKALREQVEGVPIA